MTFSVNCNIFKKGRNELSDKYLKKLDKRRDIYVNH